jgi:hypothetical protein
MRNSKLAAKLLIEVAVFALLIDSPELMSTSMEPWLSQPNWQTASIKGPWAPQWGSR